MPSENTKRFDKQIQTDILGEILKYTVWNASWKEEVIEDGSSSDQLHIKDEAQVDPLVIPT